jgi:hypothetical protein
VAAAVGGGIGVVASLALSPAVGIVAGGLLGPLAGLAIPQAAAHETAPLGTPASAERYGVQGVPHEPVAPPDGQADGPPDGQADGPPGRPPDGQADGPPQRPPDRGSA